MLRKWLTRRRTGVSGAGVSGAGVSGAGVSGAGVSAGASAAGVAAVARVTFVTRAGCTLCAEALPVVERVAAAAGVPLEVLDVDIDAPAEPALREWSDHVPVVLLDGAVHSRWWVDEGKLRAALSAGSPHRV